MDFPVTFSSRDGLLRILPTPDFELRHPETNSLLKLGRCHVPGSRVLMEASLDGTKLWCDLPIGAAIMFPTALSVDSGEVTDAPPHIQWYGQQLKDGYCNRAGQTSVLPKVDVRRKCRAIVVLNCIDHLYGHCLLKLLNSHDILSRHPDLGLCVLVQKEMRPLVPDGAAEIWEVDVPLKLGVEWFESIANWFTDRMTQYDEVYFSKAYSHPAPRSIDLKRHLPDHRQPKYLTSHSPVISIQVREDRCWGGTVRRQEKRILKLHDELRWRFHQCALILIGLGTPSHARQDGIYDLRTETLTTEVESGWFAAMCHSDVAVGVHGSNMLLPSGLAKSTVELLPQFKYPNLGQDLLFAPELSDPRDALLSCVILFGDDDLIEISPERLATVIANQVTYSPINRRWFHMSPDEDGTCDLRSHIRDVDRLRGFWTKKGRGIPARLKASARTMLLRLANWLE